MQSDSLSQLRAEIQHKKKILALRSELKSKQELLHAHQIDTKRAQLLTVNLPHHLPSSFPPRLLPYHCGLYNLGNTCDMASVFQCLYASYAIKQRLHIVAADLRELPRLPTTVLDHLAILFDNMHSTFHSALSPRSVHSMLPKPFCSLDQRFLPKLCPRHDQNYVPTKTMSGTTKTMSVVN